MGIVDFNEPELNASPCSFELRLPKLSLSFKFPIPFPPPFALPIPMLRFALSCDLSKPLDVTAGIAPGGGRTAQYDPDPDDEDT